MHIIYQGHFILAFPKTFPKIDGYQHLTNMLIIDRFETRNLYKNLINDSLKVERFSEKLIFFEEFYKNFIEGKEYWMTMK